MLFMMIVSLCVLLNVLYLKYFFMNMNFPFSHIKYQIYLFLLLVFFKLLVFKGFAFANVVSFLSLFEHFINSELSNINKNYKLVQSIHSYFTDNYCSRCMLDCGEMLMWNSSGSYLTSFCLALWFQMWLFQVISRLCNWTSMFGHRIFLYNSNPVVFYTFLWH